MKFLIPIGISALFLTLVLLFSFKGEIIVKKSFKNFWIAIPLFIQTILIFSLGYFLLSRMFKLT